MLVIPGRSGKDTCDGITRRDLLRVGGSAMIGLTLADILGLQARAKEGGVEEKVLMQSMAGGE